MEELIVTDLNAYCKDKRLLKNLHFKLPLGHCLTIIGESGSGKTLLTKLLIGQAPKGITMTGSITYRGSRLDQLSQKQFRAIRGKQIAYLVQNPMAMFNPFQRIKIHFLESLLSHEKCSKQDCLQKAVTTMKELQLNQTEELLEKYPFELSGGMLQRIMLAIVLCMDPQTIILDEPTSSLDANNRNNIIDILKGLIQTKKTLIIVTHDYQLVKAIEGEVLVMQEGSIVERGNSQSLLRLPKNSYSKDLLLKNHFQRLVSEYD
ncbi:ATP-binding cassette domain-containing protein [Streptococcus catagoni]|uniref:ATP-binding cassette domain-containing protein n=1 Tax=Streptococcus catagoni TaxID=2654874 RepID=UPI0014091F29|nr:ATP-binding cassette domain-containing protein [Streptococcus catagoni]